ncbi:Acidobacterial duplicated orphan permease (function unknown) [Olavius sp. associated proteobacterium Delta 1]|nr:Acidobacterial duplicated orphan permease (function unknown) [Olavius sp. associated proteobacterium Delta 1]
MLKNYLIVAVRNILRHKVYSFINLMGLSVGMACCTLLLLWIQDELSYDRFHENAEDIYRVIQNIKFADRSTTWAITQGPLGPSLKKDFPEIINSTRTKPLEFITLNYKDKTFDETILLADGSIFEMFSFPFLKGDPRTALANSHSMVLAEEMAEKYFGGENPIGKTITVKIYELGSYQFSVTGVMRKLPRNSSLKPKIIIPFIFGKELGATVDRWDNSFTNTFVQLQKNSSYQKVVPKISGYLFDKPTIEKESRLDLQPLKKIHLYSNYDFDGAHGDISQVVIFSLVAALILLIACTNYMNLATARAAGRAREVGIRKVFGAVRADIVKQFFGESTLLAFLALLLAIMLVDLLLPVYNHIVNKDLSLTIFSSFPMNIGMLWIALFTGIVSGSYPALFISSFKPVRILRGALQSGARDSTLRKTLIVVQFSLTILLIICTAISSNQINYLQDKKLGYDRESMLLVSLRGKVRKRFPNVKNELLKHPNIMNVTVSSSLPSRWFHFSNSLWHWEGQHSDEEILFRGLTVGDDFFETFGMQIVDGSSFSNKFPTDKTEAVIVNEAAVKVMRMYSPVGRRLTKGNRQYVIVGVVKNYHFRSLHHKIEPMILLYREDPGGVLAVKLRSDDISKTISFIENLWEKFEPDFPIIYGFIAELLTDWYISEKRIETSFRYFSFLAVFIAGLGLFGLASFITEQRVKEIGIRKTLGASISNIVVLLTKEFTQWVLAANIIAWPLAYLSMNYWLQNFAYRVALTPWPFLFAAALAIVIALITVIYQTVKAALANPVDSLRYE